MLSTLALVMVLCGTRSQGRNPSAVPRSASGKIRTSMAFCVPSGCGIAAMPTNSPCLTSAIDCLTTARTGALSASFTFNVVPSRAFTVSIWPSTLSIEPRTRTISGACATAKEAAKSKAKVPAPASRRVIAFIIILPLFPPAVHATATGLQPRGRYVIPAALPAEGQRSASSRARNSAVTSGLLPNHSKKPRTA